MKVFGRLLGLATLALALVQPAQAEIAAYVSISSNPNNENGVAPREGGFPPQPGVELFVFNPLANLMLSPDDLPEPPYGTDYTITFKTSEQPASVVAIPGRVLSYTYTENTSGDPEFPHNLVIEFSHERYAGGVEAELPGPVSDFAIALLPAVSLGENGPPAEMRGSYLATNISPLSWTLIPPTPGNVNFGYEVSGNNGQTAFFDIFVPDGLIAALSALAGRPITQNDLSLFSNNTQASSSFRRIEGANPGALIEVLLTFSPTTNVVEDADDVETSSLVSGTSAYERAGEVTKRLTVGEAPALSLIAARKAVKSGGRVKVYGWAKNGSAGELVKILSQNLINSRGASQAVVKKVRLDAERKFQTSLRVFQTDSFKAVHKPAAGKKASSKRVKITAR